MQHVIRGRGCLTGINIASVLEALYVQKPLLICGARMAEVFRSRTGMDWPVFSGYHPNPDLADSTAGAAMYREMGCDGLISLGGGSAMDTAKAIKALLLTGDMERVKRSELPTDIWLPHVAIPGTAGTGSEATPFAVVYVNEQKLSLDHPQLLPEAVVLDGSLLTTLPEYHRKACAMDALAQGIESFWASGATEDSRGHAVAAVRGVLEHIDAYLAGNDAAQEGMLAAAYESGVAIATSRTTAAHAMSYGLTKRLGYAHGHACMLTLPHLWRLALVDEQVRPVQERLARELGLADAWALSDVLLDLMKRLQLMVNVPTDLELLEALAATVNVQRLGNHPQQLSEMQLAHIYAQALRMQ